MKKFLSMVLALVMAMSLVTVSAGAKDFTDSEKLSGEQFEEAVNVMSEMGIIDGYNDGSFQPQGTLTRGAAAKIIACMMLGKTTAESLGTQAAPFKDVPVGSTFAGYIAYCSEAGIIDGYSDGTFRPGNTLTGFAFLKMLLTALGYDSAVEGFANNANWTVNVASRAIEAGLTVGNEGFVGTKAATREEACLYAVNTLKATLVEYETKGTEITINGAVIAQGASKPTYVTSNIAGAATSINDAWDNTTHDYTVEFAEKYQPDLALISETDAFGRPSHTWTWEKVEIGSYIDRDKLVAEYTTKVTGRDLYDLLGSYAIDHDELLVTIDGVDDARRNDNIFGANNMIKSNTKAVGDTGNGVLTQVFRDTEDGVIYIAIINTYLAIATDDYDEKDDTLDVEVYAYDHRGNNPANIKNADLDDAIVSDMVADNEDVAVADYAEDDIMLVRIADGEILEVIDPEVISDATVTAYSLTKNTVTSGGTTYDKADTRLYDMGILDDQYTTPENLKDLTYNIILDPYGYFIGLERNEDPDQYVFITGYEEYTKNLTSAVAEAGAIFVDGNMENIDVKVKDSMNWDPNGDPVLNTWYTYTVNSNGVYTLGNIAFADDENPFDDINDDVAQYAVDYPNGKDIDKSHISLPGWAGGVVYGNADTVYLTVDTEVLSNTSTTGVDVAGWAQIIDDVVSVTTGVKNANISVRPFEFDETVIATYENAQGNDVDVVGTRNNASGGVYTLYNDKGYIIATVVVGDDDAASSNYVFAVSSNANLETYSSEEDEHTWTREVIVNGELKELTYVGDAIDYIGRDCEHPMIKGGIYKVSYNADGEVVKSEPVDADFIDDPNQDQVIDAIAEIETNDDAVLLILDLLDDQAAELNIKGWSLYTSHDWTHGLAIADDAKAVLIERVDGKAMDEVTYFDSKEDNVADAIDAMYTDGDAIDHSAPFNGMIYAILEDGVATSVIFVDDESRPGVNDGGVIVRDNVVVNGDAMLTVPAGNSAESVRISSTGAISYSFNVGDDKADYAATYTRTVYVDGARVSRGTVEDVVDDNGDLYGAVNIGNNYDKGNEVEVVITNLVLTPPEEPEPIVNPLLKAEVIGKKVYTNYAEVAAEGKADVVDYATLVKVALEEKGYSDVVVTVNNDDTLAASGVKNGITFTFDVDPANADVAVVTSEATLKDALEDSDVDTIYLGEGTFTLNALSIDHSVEIIGVPDESQIVTKKTGAGAGAWGLHITEQETTLKISGVAFVNGTGEDACVIAIKDIGGDGTKEDKISVEIDNCSFTGYPWGIQIFNGADSSVTNCVFDCGTYDISVGEVHKDKMTGMMTISGNTYSGNEYDIEVFAADADDVLINKDGAKVNCDIYPGSEDEYTAVEP